MKKNDKILIGCFAAMLLFLSTGTLLSPKTAFSENENRFLQKPPEISAASVLNGTFESQTERYLSDHILGRQFWIAATNGVQKETGVSDINGTYLCADGRAVQKITESDFDRKQYETNLRQIAELQKLCREKKIPCSLLMVPTAASVYEKELPAHALRFDENSAFTRARAMLPGSFLDLRPALSDYEKRDTFFRTDHHWSGYGAFLAAQNFRKACGLPACPKAFDSEILTRDFQGTLHSRVLLDSMGTDTIEAPKQHKQPSYRVSFGGKTYDSLYFPKYLRKKDKYAVYFGGNYARCDITHQRKAGVTSSTDISGIADSSGSANGSGIAKGNKKYGVNADKTGKESLLILKDSFANSFVPHILGDFNKITMLDTRYYRGNISRLAEKYDRVLLLYSITSLAEQKLNLTKNLLQ